MVNIAKNTFRYRHAVINDALYVVIEAGGDFVWRLDNNGGTKLNFRGGDYLVAIGSRLYTEGLLIYDAISSQLTSIPVGHFDYIDPMFTRIGNKVYFRTRDGLNVTDGTPAGTRRLSELDALVKGSSIGRLSAINGKLYFSANSLIYGTELWSYAPLT